VDSWEFHKTRAAL